MSLQPKARPPLPLAQGGKTLHSCPCERGQLSCLLIMVVIIPGLASAPLCLRLLLAWEPFLNARDPFGWRGLFLSFLAMSFCRTTACPPDHVRLRLAPSTKAYPSFHLCARNAEPFALLSRICVRTFQMCALGTAPQQYTYRHALLNNVFSSTGAAALAGMWASLQFKWIHMQVRHLQVEPAMALLVLSLPHALLFRHVSSVVALLVCSHHCSMHCTLKGDLWVGRVTSAQPHFIEYA
eukprot:545444-Pelagomonas_calceolata.AAC.3